MTTAPPSDRLSATATGDPRVSATAPDDAGVVVVTIDRPEAANALTLAMQGTLAATLTAALAAPDTRALVLTGAGGRAFCAGADLRELAGPAPPDGAAVARTLRAALEALEAAPVPAVAALNGAAMGGGAELALACDLRVAAADAVLSFRQVTMGLVTAWGGARRLLRLVGPAGARRLLLTGAEVSADEAWRIGLVDQRTAPGDALDAALALARRLASLPPLATGGLKQLLARLPELDREAAAALEEETFLRLWASADRAEAMCAFLERRAPRWRGR
jgi:enoyl-CoA hydratase/carnithine racemase